MIVSDCNLTVYWKCVLTTLEGRGMLSDVLFVKSTSSLQRPNEGTFNRELAVKENNAITNSCDSGEMIINSIPYSTNQDISEVGT